MAKNCVHLELYSVSPMNSLSVYKFDLISLTPYFVISDFPPQYAVRATPRQQTFLIIEARWENMCLVWAHYGHHLIKPFLDQTLIQF